MHNPTPILGSNPQPNLRSQSVVALAARYQPKHGKGLTDAEWEYLRSEPCGICEQPYHRYCDHDPEHVWAPVACINSLQGRIEALIAALRDVVAANIAGKTNLPSLSAGVANLNAAINAARALLPPEPQR